MDVTGLFLHNDEAKWTVFKGPSDLAESKTMTISLDIPIGDTARVLKISVPRRPKWNIGIYQTHYGHDSE